MTPPPLIDEEKGLPPPSPNPSPSPNHSTSPPTSDSAWSRLNTKILSLSHLETRGIERVPLSSRHEITPSLYLQIVLLWFSTNITANNIAVGMLGPLAFDLGFLDSALCAVFGAVLGAMGAAYMGTFGPESGCRTMVIARYFMGYYPSKICCLLNIVIMLGYGMLDCLVGGQVLSAVAGGKMSVVVGVIIVAVITWIVVVFGMDIFQVYEKYAWAPQLFAILILVGCAGPKFNTNIQSLGSQQTINGNRLSFFSLCLSASIAWAPAAADYFVYYPPTTQKWKTFTMALLGIGLSLSFANLMGVGLASGTFSNDTWETAYSTSSGSLIMAGFEGLGGFGKFLGVIISFGLIANNIPGTYSATLSFQVMARWIARLPRWLVSCFGVVIYTACALGGRNHLFDIFENFLALMGYWVTIFLTIVIEEHLFFRRGKEYDWSIWDISEELPVGIAALIAFLVGWVGSIISMYQIWYVGPVAKLVGEYGTDLGIWVGIGFAMVVFPPLRWFELRKFHR